MDYKFESSIKRANKIFGVSADCQDYLLLKFMLEPFSCHDLNHWPRTCEQINKHIDPCGPISGEGDVLIKKDGNEFVLESHESGPEIIVKLAYVTAVATLLKSVIDLAITIIKRFARENRRPSSRIKISKRQIVQGKLEENNIEIDIPLSKDTERKLEERIKKLLDSN